MKRRKSRKVADLFHLWRSDRCGQRSDRRNWSRRSDRLKRAWRSDRRIQRSDRFGHCSERLIRAWRSDRLGDRSDRFHGQRPDPAGRDDENLRFQTIPRFKRHKNHRGSRSAHKQHIYWITISKTHQEFQIGARVFKFGEEHMNPRNKKLIDRSYRGNQEL